MFDVEIERLRQEEKKMSSLNSTDGNEEIN